MTQRIGSHSGYLNTGALLILASLLFAGAANAAGYGGYIGLDYTEGTVDVFGVDFDHDRAAVDFGFVMDTNLAQDRLFNYRLRLGLQAGTREYSADGLFSEQDTFGFAFTNTFGFGILRTPALRLWVGPSIRFSVDSCTNCSGFDSVFLAFGAGPEIGLNFNIGSHLTIGPSLAYNYMFGVDFTDIFGFTDDFSGPQHHVSVLVNIFFRTGSDTYGTRGSQDRGIAPSQ